MPEPTGDLLSTGNFAALETIDASEIADGSIGTTKLAAGAVTKAKTAMFVSTEQTGTGAPQNVAHGLGAVPTAVFVGVTDDALGAGYVVAEGAHGATNVIVTVTATVKFKVMAWA